MIEYGKWYARLENNLAKMELSFSDDAKPCLFDYLFWEDPTSEDQFDEDCKECLDIVEANIHDIASKLQLKANDYHEKIRSLEFFTIVISVDSDSGVILYFANEEIEEALNNC